MMFVRGVWVGDRRKRPKMETYAAGITRPLGLWSKFIFEGKVKLEENLIFDGSFLSLGLVTRITSTVAHGSVTGMANSESTPVVSWASVDQ